MNISNKKTYSWDKKEKLKKEDFMFANQKNKFLVKKPG